jgi:hypothetical protein
LVLRQTATQAELLSLNADGSMTLITALEDVDFRTRGSYKGIVPVAVDTIPSPEGDMIAFTAYGVGNQTSLFIISLNPLRIRQFDAPGIAALEWSPAGDAILLTSPSLYLGGEGRAIVGSAYIFELATETFVSVAESSSTELVRDAVWLPNGDRIILNIERRTPSHDLYIADLHLVNRDGTQRQQLTNLSEQAPQSINFEQPIERNSCNIADIQWSTLIRRIYYVLICDVYSEVPLISLFSVNLDGENRLEVDLFEQFPAEFTPLRGVGHDLIDLFTGQDGVFLVVNSPAFNLVIVSIDGLGHVETTLNIPSKEGRLAAISESGTKIAISMNGGEVAAINLSTKRITILSATGSPSVVCRVQWIGDETILIDEVVSCNRGNAQFFTPLNVIAWNPSTGVVQNDFGTIGGIFKLVIPRPNYP